MSAAPLPARVQNARGEGQRLYDVVLDAACSLLEESGSEREVTLRATARRAGVTATALYRHFDNRDALVQAAIERVWRTFEEAIHAASASSDTPNDQLRACCVAYVAFGHDRPAAYRVLFSRQDPSPVPLVGDRAASLLESVVAMVVNCGWPAGDARAAAVTLWLSMHGLAELPPSHPRFPWPETSTLLDRILEPFIDPTRVVDRRDAGGPPAAGRPAHDGVVAAAER